MIEGRPHILVVGGADTGRAPLLAALLRRELGRSASVASAGVLGHAGEPADPNAHLALEQLGLGLDDHIARELESEVLAPADLLIAVDRGVARVAQMRTAKQVMPIGELAGSADVRDPHRMPLGAWVAALRAYQAQVATALPAIRAQLKLSPLEQATEPPPLEPASPVPAATPQMDGAAPGARHEHISRITRLLDTARLLPEIVDWPRLAQEAGDRLRAIAAMAEDANDFTPAVTAMIAGRLLNTATTPGEDQLTPLLSAVERLATPVDAAALAEIAQLIGRM